MCYIYLTLFSSEKKTFALRIKIYIAGILNEHKENPDSE